MYTTRKFAQIVLRLKATPTNSTFSGHLNLRRKTDRGSIYGTFFTGLYGIIKQCRMYSYYKHSNYDLYRHIYSYLDL